MSYEPSLEILEVEYSCSPGGVDLFEVYDKTDIPLAMPIYETESLTDVITCLIWTYRNAHVCKTHMSEWKTLLTALEN
jgi:hypothetical protein